IRSDIRSDRSEAIGAARARDVFRGFERDNPAVSANRWIYVDAFFASVRDAAQAGLSLRVFQIENAECSRADENRGEYSEAMQSGAPRLEFETIGVAPWNLPMQGDTARKAVCSELKMGAFYRLLVQIQRISVGMRGETELRFTAIRAPP